MALFSKTVSTLYSVYTTVYRLRRCQQCLFYSVILLLSQAEPNSCFKTSLVRESTPMCQTSVIVCRVVCLLAESTGVLKLKSTAKSGQQKNNRKLPKFPIEVQARRTENQFKIRGIRKPSFTHRKTLSKTRAERRVKRGSHPYLLLPVES